MDAIGDGHERRRPPGREPGWVEVHRVDAVAADRGLALSWSVTARPHEGRAGFLAALLRAGHPPVVLAEHDAELPAAGWELRTSGLWADNVCETPFEHWSYGLEAFALLVDDPAELLGRALGDRVPLGWELEFEAEAEAEPEGPSGYRQAGEVHGLLLLGRDRLEVSLEGTRRRWWGRSAPDALVGARPDGAVALPGVTGTWWSVLGGGGGLAVGWDPR